VPLGQALPVEPQSEDADERGEEAKRGLALLKRIAG